MDSQEKRVGKEESRATQNDKMNVNHDSVVGLPASKLMTQ